MVFYAFALDELYAAYQRGHIPDRDLVTFTLFVNEERRGWLGGRVPAVATGSRTPFSACQVDTSGGCALFTGAARTSPANHWMLGPIEVAPGDLITLVVTGTNTSDSGLTDQAAEKFEIKMLDTIVTLGLNYGLAQLAAGGLLGDALDKLLEALDDPAGTFLGWHPQGPCDGMVFSDTRQFTGAQAAAFDYAPPPVGVTSSDTVYGLDQATHTLPTPHLTDEQYHHDTDHCGHIAETELTISVVRLPYLSLFNCLGRDLSPELDVRDVIGL